MSHMHGRDTCPHIPWIRPNATVNYYISPAHKKGGYLMKMVINFCNSCVPPVPPCLLILVRVSLYPMAFNWAIPASCSCRSLIGMTTMLQDGLGRLSSSNFLLGFWRLWHQTSPATFLYGRHRIMKSWAILGIHACSASLQTLAGARSRVTLLLLAYEGGISVI